MEELDRKLKAKARRTYVPLLLLTLLFAVIGAGLLFSALSVRKNEFRELAEQDGSQLETGDYYTLSDSNMIFDAFAEDKDGEYFVMYRESDGKWMGLYLKGKNKETAEKMMQENWDYLNEQTDSLSSTTISVKGRLRSMDTDEERFFRDWMTSSGWTADEADEDADFRTLDTSDTNAGMPVAGAVILALSLIGLGFILKNLVGGGFQKKVMEKLTARGISPERASAELARGTSFKNVDVTPSFALLSGGTAELLPYDELIWVYGQTHTTKHKIYGIIPAGQTVTHNVLLVDRDQKTHTVACRNEKESQEILEQIHRYAPYVIAGYSDEIAKVAGADFQQMVRHVDSRRSEQL